MEDIKLENIEKLLQSEPSEILLIKALKGLKVKPKDKKERGILILVCCALGFGIGICNGTVTILQNSTEAILDVVLALFGIIFTGYALLQAFMNKQLLYQMLKDVKGRDTEEEKTRLQDVNETFVYLMILYVIAIIITLILRIVLYCIPGDYMLFRSLLISNSLAGILIALYFSFIGIILWRTIGFVSSVFQLFNVYAVAQLLEYLDKNNKT